MIGAPVPLTENRVLVIGARDSSFAGSIDGRLGLDLIQAQDRFTPIQQALADRVEIVDLRDTPAVLATARALHSARPVGGVTAFHEHFLDLAAQVAEDLGVPGTSRAAITTAGDKARTRQVAEQNGLSQPRHAVLQDLSQLQDALKRTGFPAIVKPLNGAGSVNIHLVTSHTQAIRLAISQAPEENSGWIVEQYLDGPEFSVESFTGGGGTVIRAITEKLVDPDTFVELGHQLPARITPELHDRLVADVSRLQAGIGLDVGPGHTEFRVVDGIPHLIETHVRYGGDRIWEMTGLSTGYYPQAEMLAELACLPAVPVPVTAQATAVRFLLAEPGVVRSVEGVERARSTAGVLTVEVGVEPGSPVRPLRSSGDRVGYVLAGADTTEEAIAIAETAAAGVLVHSEPGR